MNQQDLAEHVAALLSDKIVEVDRETIGQAPSRAPLVDIHGIAGALCVSEVTIRRLVADGMPVTWIASAMRFDVDECKAWNRERGKRSVTKEPKTRRLTEDGPVAGVVLKTRRR
jgi:hypothetical protein